MQSTSLSIPLTLDPLQAARGLAACPGTLLLHTQRPWGSYRRSALLFSPRWILRQYAGQPPHWSGEVPAPKPPALSADRLVGDLASLWPREPFLQAPFTGLAGCLSFELGSARVNARPGAPPPFHFPDAWIGAYDLALVFGPGETPRLVVSDLYPVVPRRAKLTGAAKTQPLRARAEEALERLHAATAINAQASKGSAPPTPPSAGLTSSPEFFDARWHEGAVDRVKRYLRAGEVYQVNLTGMATARASVSPFEAFLDQAKRNPVPFAAYLNAGEAVICSHSPELLLSLDGERAETAPIKGTSMESPGDLEALHRSDKDRAEHVMIVDLCRNDLGITAKYGTVRVEEFMQPLRLHHLVHLVSRITATIPRERQARLLSDLFPGGSVTGAPKRRAIEIISQLELSARGPYTGSLGFWDRSGRALWNIAIRTAVWQEQTVSFGCGGGIVLDSDPAREYQEAVLKARSFFDTLNTLGALDPHARPVAQQGA
jgi:para-aminobenzoate synthetase component 1